MHAMLTKSATFANLVSTQQNVHAAVATNDQLRKQYGLPTAEELQAGYQEARRNIIVSAGPHASAAYPVLSARLADRWCVRAGNDGVRRVREPLHVRDVVRPQ